jgi:hypothetical protein
VNAELTSTLRCAYHKYTFAKGDDKSLLVDIRRSNNDVRDWKIEKVDDNTFTGYQDGDGKIYFYAKTNYKIGQVEMVKDDKHEVAVLRFIDSKGVEPLEVKAGFSFVSIENAQMNLKAEMLNKSFAQVAEEADAAWEALLSKIQVAGGTEREKRLFYSTFFHAFKWPALRSDVNHEYTDVRGEVVNNGFHYYTDPSFWDDYRNKLVLIGMISPDVTTDIIRSIIDKGEKRDGYMPTFFHGDHASTFISGSWLRGLHDFDLERAYKLILKNATVPGKGGRRYWSSEHLVEVIQILARNRHVLDKINQNVISQASQLVLKAWYKTRKNSLSGSRKNIAEHYDLSNDFFKLFLDSSMMYSSAVYKHQDMTLEEASDYKKELICQKLQLKPMDHLVEIGSGWGGFAIYAAQHYGCKVTTITISQAQYDEAKNAFGEVFYKEK